MTMNKLFAIAALAMLAIGGVSLTATGVSLGGAACAQGNCAQGEVWCCVVVNGVQMCRCTGRYQC
jgi:hypothetical protein